MANKLNQTDKIYKQLTSRYNRTTRFYLAINILIFLVASSIILFNIFAIRKNPSTVTSTKWLFVGIAISTGVSAFFSSVLSLYVFRKRNKELNEKIESIKIEKQKFRKKELIYSEDNPEAKLVKQVKSIINN